MDSIMEGMDPTMALAQMLWEGFPLAGMDFWFSVSIIIEDYEMNEYSRYQQFILTYEPEIFSSTTSSS